MQIVFPSRKWAQMLTLLILMTRLSLSESFGVTTPRIFRPAPCRHTHRSLKTTLKHSTLPSETEKGLLLPSWETLPLRRPRQSRDALDTVELVVGRIAMIGALSLLAGEILNGESIWEQVVESVSRFS